MKGMDLPINMIVIVAIAVLVLVVVAGFFGGFFTRGLGDIEFNKAFDGACSQFSTLYNCNVNEIRNVQVRYQPPGESEDTYNLLKLCNKKLGVGSVKSEYTDRNKCAQSCGCAISPPGFT